MKFTEILDQYNIEYIAEGHHHCRTGWIQIDCPFCGRDSHKWHLGYSLENHFLNCWRCGPHSAVEVLHEYTEISFAACTKILSDIEVSVLPKKEKPKGKLILPKGLNRLQAAHRKYLRGRGFGIAPLESLWQIQGIGLASKLQWRIFIPIIYHGKVVSWTTRSISNNGTRYISASPSEEELHHKSLLYGEDYVRDIIIVNEGSTDVWRIGPGAVATLGTGYSTEQVSKIIKYRKRIICFDSAKEAQARANNLCADLSVFPGETINILLDAEDPASASDKEIKLIRKEFLR